MQYYLVLIIATAATISLGYLIWQKTRELSFLVGLGIIYYFSLLGGWTIVTDQLGGTFQSYQFLYDKMFYVVLDDSYLITLIYYSLFIVIIGLVVWQGLHSTTGQANPAAGPLQVRHTMILAVSGAALFLSYFVIREQIIDVMFLAASLYSSRYAWEHTIRFYTISQELNVIAFTATMLGLAVFCSGKRARLIVGVEGWWVGAGYLVLLLGLIFYNFFLGARGLFAGASITFFLFFWVNTGHSRRVNRMVIGGMLLVAVLFLSYTTTLRGMPLMEIQAEMLGLGEEDRSLVDIFFRSLEKFAAHMSMYGALTFKVPITYGSSFVALGASLIPRAVWPNRPDDIYLHYAERVGATMDQGYTIHHATGWYLNFGLPGLVLGAVVIGLLWAATYNRFRNWRGQKSRFMALAALLVPWLFVGYFPTLLRGGIEGYKGLFFDAFLFPTLIFYVALCRKGLKPQPGLRAL